MPRATLKIKSNEALVTLSESHPASSFEVLGAWPTDGKLRVLVETSTLKLSSLETTLAAIPTLTDVDIRHSSERSILFEVTTPSPLPHGAMADSGIVPSFPLHLEDGWFVGDLTATQDRLSTFRDELAATGIEHELIQVTPTDGKQDILTGRQREIVGLAVEHGYYEVPRRCTLTELATMLDVNKSVVSRVLHRAESRIVIAYWSSGR